MLTEEQARLRRGGIGSSDIGALLGESRWANAHDVWLSKLDLVENEESEPAWWGTHLEPVIAKRYGRDMGVALVRGQGAVRHPKSPIALASPDYLHADRSRVVECKAVFRTAIEWSDDHDGVPPQYMLQANWQCGVLGIPAFSLAVFVAPFADFRIYQFDYDEALFGHCLTVAERFWRDHVLTRVPPPVDHSESATKALLAAYPPRRPLVPAPPEAEALVAERARLVDELERAKAAYDLANNRLREMIADAEGIRGDWGYATWKPDKRGVRSLRVKLNEQRKVA